MNLDKRQKIILVVLIILVAFLIWQIVGLRKPSTPKGVTPTKTQAAKPTPTPPVSAQEPAPQVVSNFSQPQLLAPQQLEYLQTVDQYQLAQIKRMLAEQIAATATADESTAKARVETNKILLGSATYPLPTQAGAAPTQPPLAAIPTQPTAQTAASIYQVVFIGHKENSWSAILAKNGEYVIVTPGMTLSDRSTVTDINASGVTLKLDDTTAFIPFQNNLIG